MPSEFDKRRICLCVGPGGVGKTTCAAALALAVARSGRKVVVVTIDPSLRLAQALGLDREADCRGMPVPVERVGNGTLDALLLDTKTVFDGLVMACAKDPAAARRILENPIYQATVLRLGGALEYAAMAQVQLLHAGRGYDLVVVDTPPTANAIDLLEAPAHVREIVDNPAARLLSGTGKLGMRILGLGGGVLLKTLQAMGGGPFITDLGTFLHDFADVIDEFRRRAGDFEDMLTSRDTGFVLVTTATSFSAREAAEFLAELAGRNMQVDGVVFNRVDPSLPAMPPRDFVERALRGQTGSAEDVDRVLAAYRGARTQADREREARDRLHVRSGYVPIVQALRREPPPSTLDELAGFGDDLLQQLIKTPA